MSFPNLESNVEAIEKRLFGEPLSTPTPSTLTSCRTAHNAITMVNCDRKWDDDTAVISALLKLKGQTLEYDRGQTQDAINETSAVHTPVTPPQDVFREEERANNSSRASNSMVTLSAIPGLKSGDVRKRISSSIDILEQLRRQVTPSKGGNNTRTLEVKRYCIFWQCGIGFFFETLLHNAHVYCVYCL